jgi:hypothetical protein
LWNSKPENRHLPAWREWLNIRLFTRKRDWTPPQRKMMRQAGRFHLVRGVALLLLVLVLGWGSYEVRGSLGALLLRHIQDSPEGSKEHLHASLALIPVDDGQTEFLYRRLLKAGPAELPVLRDALLPQHEEVRLDRDQFLGQAVSASLSASARRGLSPEPFSSFAAYPPKAQGGQNGQSPSQRRPARYTCRTCNS